jgi:polyisoprenyl-phosphate glycosyltransferase
MISDDQLAAAQYDLLHGGDRLASPKPTRPTLTILRPMVDISIVIPVYGCDSCLRPLHDRLKEQLMALGVAWELVFVNDASPDESWSVLTELSRETPEVNAFQLSRNFGEEAALLAGLSQSKGRWTVVMDCDLQDLPEDIPRLYAKVLEGYEIVFTKRRSRGHSRLRIWGSRFYYRLVSRFLKGDVDPSYGNFSMVSRRVVDLVLSVRDRDRQYRMILAWLGLRQTAVDVENAARHAGESAYGIRGLARHAVEGVFFQTETLLRWIVYAGIAIGVGGMFLAGFFMVQYFVGNEDYPGWTSLAVLILLTTGVVTVSTGVTGLYIGKIFGQVKDRPLYVIEKSLAEGIESENSQIAVTPRATDRAE